MPVSALDLLNSVSENSTDNPKNGKPASTRTSSLDLLNSVSPSDTMSAGDQGSDQQRIEGLKSILAASGGHGPPRGPSIPFPPPEEAPPPGPGLLHRFLARADLANENILKLIDASGPTGAEGNPLRITEDLSRNAGRGMSGLLTEAMGGPSTSTLANIPAMIPEFIGDWGAEEAHHLPLTLATMGAGELARVVGAYPAIASLVEQYAPSLVYRGGVLPESKAAMEAADLAKNKSMMAGTDLGARIVKEGGGKKGENLIGYLMTQPAMRKGLMDTETAPQDAMRNMLMQQSEVPQDVNRLHAWMQQTAKPVPGIPESVGRGGTGALPPDITPDLIAKYHEKIKTFADLSDEAAQAFGKTKEAMAHILQKDPALMTRFTELNYSPITYARPRMALFPSLSSMKQDAKFLKFRKDITQEVRDQLGVQSTGPAVALQLSRQQNFIGLQNMFQSLVDVPGVVLRDTKGLTLELEPVGGENFVRMPNDQMYGPLAGQYVRQAEAKAIKNDAAYFAPRGPWLKRAQEWWSAWKFGKTVLSPTTHVGNVVSNVPMAWKGGLNPFDIPSYTEGWDTLRRGGTVWAKELKDAGAPWMMNAGTIMEDIMPRSELSREGESMFVKGLMTVPRFMKENWASRQLAKMYQAEEGWFKTATYIANRKAGKTISESVQIADRAILNYDKMPHFVKLVRSAPLVGSPFVSFAYGVAPLAAQTALERPDIFLHYKMVLDSLNNVQAENYQVSPERWKQIQAMYPGSLLLLTGRDANGFENVRDANAGETVRDLSRYTPISALLPQRGTFFDSGGGLGGYIGDVAQNLATQNPVINEIVSQSTGIDPYTKVPFRPAPDLPGGSDTDAIGALAGMSPEDLASLKANMEHARGANARANAMHLARTAFPPPVGGGSFQDIMASLLGENNYMGQQKPVSQALIDSILGKNMPILARELYLKSKIEKIKPSIVSAARAEARRNAP